jgi:hypothetical protein
MPDVDPPNSILIDAVLNALKHGVVFLVDSEIEPEDVERLVQKTEKLAAGVIAKQFDAQTAAKFFTRSENPWILRTTFGGWVFFYPIEMLTPQTSMGDIGVPEFVFWPDADGKYARVPWQQWLGIREAGDYVWRPTSPIRSKGGKPRSVWERLRDR